VGGVYSARAGSKVGSFGDKFRIERERLGLTLDQVSNVTKISARMLKAIETEHFDQLPGGVFNKGFIRAYAKHLGFNDEESISEYLLALRQAQIDRQAAVWAESPHASALPASQPVPTKAGRPVAKRDATTAAAESRPMPRGNASTRISERPGDHQSSDHEQDDPERGDHERGDHGQRDYEKDAREAGQSSASIPLRWAIVRNSPIAWRMAALILVVTVAVAFWNRHSRRAAAQEKSPPAYNSPQTQGANGSSNLVAGASSSSSAVNSPPATKPHPSAAEEDDVVSSSPAGLLSRSAALAKTAKTASGLNLGIRASENCWIAVTVDGETTSRETLIAPAHTSIRANREIVVRVGNAAGVTFLLNGKEFPAQGGEAEVKTFTFDATGMKAANSTPLPDPVR
jgi:cytoskeletal protein RodZ